MAFAYSQAGSGVAFIASQQSLDSTKYDPVYETPVSADFLWSLMPSYFSSIMEGKENFEELWEAFVAYTPGPLLQLWQHDYGKSIRDVPIRVQKQWVNFDIIEEDDFLVDPTAGWDFTGTGATRATYISASDEMKLSFSNRSGVDRGAVIFNRVGVTQACSLGWEITLNVESSDKNGGVLIGYADSNNATAVQNFLGVALIGAASAVDSVVPYIMHTGPQGVPTFSALGVTLQVGATYRLAGTYNATSGEAMLTAYRTESTKVAGGLGAIGDGPASGDIYTDTFTDASASFVAAGVVAGDTLDIAATGETWTILTVAATSLTVSVATLPVNNTGLVYSITGESLEASAQINLPADASDPSFSVNAWTVSNLDLSNVGTGAGAIVSSILANRRSCVVNVESWWYVDPTVSEDLLSVPYLQDAIQDPTVELEEGTDFTVVDSIFQFAEAPTTALWGEYAAYNNSSLQDNFGANVGLLGTSSSDYKSRVQGLYYSYYQGPTIRAIKTGVGITLGLPISTEAGTVEAINTGYSGTLGTITINGKLYYYSLDVGTYLQVGDTVAAYQLLSNGVEFQDIYTDPTWWVSISGVTEVSKYHTFAIKLDIDAFNVDDIEQASTFVDAIKPTWKQYIFLPTKSIFDAVDVDDSLGLTLVLTVADTACGIPTVSYDVADFEGETPDWAYDQGVTEWTTVTPGMRGLATALTGTAALVDSSRTVAGTGTDWTSSIGSGTIGTSSATGVAGATDVSGAIFTDAGATFLSDISFYGPPGGIVDWHFFIEVNGEFGKISEVLSDTQCTFQGAITPSLSGESWTLYRATTFMAFGQLVEGTAIVTTAGSHVVTDPTAGAFDDVESGDIIEITGEGSAEVQAKIDANTLNLDTPMAADGVGVSWSVSRRSTVWAVVCSVASDTSLTLGTAVPPADGLGGKDYEVSLLDPDYLILYYDWQDEACPDESLLFTAELSHFWGGTILDGTYEGTTAVSTLTGTGTDWLTSVAGTYYAVFYSDGTSRQINSVDSDTQVTLNSTNTLTVAPGTPAVFWPWVSGATSTLWTSDAAALSKLTSASNYDALAEVSIGDWLAFAPHSNPTDFPISKVTAIDYNATTANRTVITLDRQVINVSSKKIVNLGPIPDPFLNGGFPEPFNDAGYLDTTYLVPERTP